MASPFHEGTAAARFELDGDAVRVFTTTVVEVGDGFVVDATGRRHDFDRSGESPDIVPLDDLLAHEIKTKGEGFAVVHEEILQEVEVEIEGPGYDR